MPKENIFDMLKELSAAEKDILLSKLEKAKLINVSSYELSFEQRIFWFTHQLNPDSPACNIPAALMIEGPLNLEILQSSFKQVIKRHDALRTYFETISGVPHQFIKSRVNFRFAYIDLKNISKHFIDAELKRLIDGFARRSFDLSYPPLMRAIVLQISETKNILCFSFHHIVFDGWSLGILLNELLSSYYSLLLNRDVNLPALPFNYKDYIKWQQSLEYKLLVDKQKNYWRNKLSGISGFLKLPTDYPRPKIRSSKGNFFNIALSKELSDLIKNFCKAEHTTLNVFFLTAVNILLYKYTDEEDIIIGSPLAKREPIETEKLIGLFLNMIVMRTQFKKSESIRTLLKKCRQVAFEAYENGHFPFSDLVELINPLRDTAYTPIFQVMLSNNNAPLEKIQFEELSITPIVNDIGDAYCDLTFMYSDTAEGILISIEYSTELFSLATIELLAAHLKSIFSLMIQEPNQLLQAIDLLSNEEKEQILNFSSPSGYKSNKLLHSLFEDIAINNPDLPALTLGSMSLTYRQLNFYADKLACLLQDMGIEAQRCVGLFMENSFEAIISMLAILKIGGIYVPLDTRNPTKRLRLIIEDAGLKYILINKNSIISWSELEDITKIEVCLDDLKQLPSFNRVLKDITNDSIAYIVYTSGSTGIPNGSMNTHAGIVSTILFRQMKFPIWPQSRVLQLTSLNFDVSVLEIFNCLAAGGELIILPPKAQQDFGRIIDLIHIYQIEILHIVPTVLHNIITHSDSFKLLSIKQIVAAGEVLSTKLVTIIQESLGCEIINAYGPSEAAVYSSYAHYKSMPEHVNIGRPLDGVLLHILDINRNIVPIGREGEIYIGGVGLAKGYLNRPLLNQERFIDNPYGIGKLFKTGDRGKWNKDGTVEYIGRVDNQIKLRGQRIELGEIEAALCSIPEIDQSCVLVHQDSSGDERLVAFIVKKASMNLTLKNLRKELEKYLPYYMIPNLFHSIDNLPVTVNGKIDKQKLRELISEKKQSKKVLSERKNFDEWFYKPYWQKEVLTVSDKVEITNKTILVFSTQNSFVSLLLDRLKKVGANVIEINIGMEYQKLNSSSFVIRPGLKEDYIKLYEDILESNTSIEYVIHLWSTLIPSVISDINQATELAFYSLLWFAQAIGTYPLGNNIRFFYFTHNLYKVLGIEKIYPFGALGAGFGKVMAQEYPFISFSSLDYWDLEEVSAAETLIDLVLEEICLVEAEGREVIAFRENTKYLRAYSLIQKQTVFFQEKPLKDKGTYLITGGLGGVGLEIAQYIAQSTGSHIILVQRTKLIDEHLWDEEILQKKTVEPTILKRIITLKEIKKHSSSLTVLQGDVSDEKSLLNVANMIGEVFNKLDGIIHAAGVAPQGMIQRKGYDVSKNILSPKVHGIVNVVNAFAEYNPKFILLCSSLSSIVGGIGLSDYVAANAFLDAFSQITSFNLISVNWPAWNVGMMVDNSLPEDLLKIQKSILDKGITNDEGIKIFEEVLLQQESHIIVSPQDLVDHINAREDLQDLNLLYGTKITHTDNIILNSREHYTETERIVVEIFENVLKIKDVTRDDHFFELGGHSLLAAQVANRLSSSFGVPIYLQKIFEYPVVSELSQWLEDNKNK